MNRRAAAASTTTQNGSSLFLSLAWTTCFLRVRHVLHCAAPQRRRWKVHALRCRECASMAMNTPGAASHVRIEGHMLLAAATLYSGSVVKKVLWLLDQVGMACFPYETCFKIQGAFLLPAIRRVWNRGQIQLFKKAADRELILAGDGRCNSSRYSAKYVQRNKGQLSYRARRPEKNSCGVRSK